MPGHQPYAVAQTTMRQRHAGIRGTGRCRGDARHDLEFDAVFTQVQGLFTATTEDEGVTTLEAHDLAWCPAIGHAQLHQQSVDLVLRDTVAAGGLAHRDAQHALGDKFEDGGRYQAIEHHHVGSLQQSQCLHRQQVRITRACPNQKDFASRLHIRSHSEQTAARAVRHDFRREGAVMVDSGRWPSLDQYQAAMANGGLTTDAKEKLDPAQLNAPATGGVIRRNETGGSQRSRLVAFDTTSRRRRDSFHAA